MSFDLFKSAVPGQSLTKEVGGAPFENPPQYANVEDALEFLWEKLTEPRQVVRLVLMLKKGMPVEYLARAILFDGFQKNKWTPDVAMLMLRITMAMIIAIAVSKGVKPSIFNPDKEQDKFLDQFIDDTDMDMDIETPSEERQEGNALPEEFTGLLGASV